MRAIVLDPGLSQELGHYHHLNISLSQAFTARGIQSIHLVHRACTDIALGGMAAGKLFRHTPHEALSFDGLVGTAETFFIQSDSITEDLGLIPPGLVTRDDLVIPILNTPPLAIGYLRWWRQLAPEDRPRTVMIFVMPSGLKSIDPLVLFDHSYWAESARFYRFFGNQLDPTAAERIHFLAPEDLVDDFSFLLHGKVGPMPVNAAINSVATDPLAEAFEQSAAPPTIGYFGDNRLEKGFQFLPEIIEGLLSQHATVEFVIQMLGTDLRVSQQDALTRLSALSEREKRVRLLPGHLPSDAYYSAMAGTDFVLLPYQQEFYQQSPSGLFTEAMMLGRPAVVPKDTWMARQVAKLGTGAVAGDHTAEAMIDAALALLDQVPKLRARGPKLRETWRALHGSDRMVQAILTAATA